MISEKMTKALNTHLNEETFSAYLYMSMAAYFTSINLEGCSHWMELQAQEEMAHARKFYEYINDRGSRVVLESIDKPQSDWESPLNAFEEAYKHEKLISSKINELVKLAIEENDYATHTFLQWFVTEQVEEEATADSIVQQFKLMGDNKSGLFMIDRELKGRQASAE